MTADNAAISPEQLASLSHEFRTPLNGVLGMAQLLEGTRLTAEQRAYVAALRESGQHLLSLVNDVLDFAKLGAARIDLACAPVDIDELLRSVCELVAPRAQEKGVEVAWAAAPGLATFAGDEGRLRQVLLNFVGNAVKFTEAGGVLITAEDAPDGLRLAVADSGPGVPEAARRRIFEPFVQVDAAHGALGGAGLGLAIVARLAAAMAGEVGVDSGLDGGAVFWLRAPGYVVRRRGDELAGHRVVVASTNPVLRAAARLQVAASGGETSFAASLVEAVAADGDTVLIDRPLLARAKPPAALLKRPCVVLLTPTERAAIAGHRRDGFAGYLIKPLRRASLAERVRVAHGEPASPAAVEDDRVASGVAPGMRVLLAEDDPISAMLAKTLLRREGCEVDHAPTGEAAMVAVETSRYDLILMDLRMPKVSGLEATRRLRAMGISTPVVALTADAFEDDRRACLAAGMNDFLVKPLAPDALRAMLARWTADGWTQHPAHAKLAG